MTFISGFRLDFLKNSLFKSGLLFWIAVLLVNNVMAQATVSISANDTTICAGSSVTLTANATGSGTIDYLWDDDNQTTSSITVSPTTTTTYQVIVTDGNSDSDTATLTIIVLQNSTSDTTATACNSFTWYGNTYSSTGIYTRTISNASGCDSTITLNLTVNTSTYTDSTADVCDSLIWRGTKRTTSGTYVYTYTNEDGCASADTLHLTVRNSSISTTTHAACGSYEWNAVTYTTSGSYTYTTTNAAGCDSVATLNLTINSSNTSTTTHTACNSYTWNGTSYTTSGTYEDTLINAAGCDSVATLNLTINYSTYTDSTADVCDSLIWRGTNRTTSGTYVYTYTNEDGCASADTLRLTVRNSSTSTTTHAACGSYEWNALTYTTSGSYTYTTTNAAGCDSVATLNLTINASSTSTTTHTACNSYTWNGSTYTTSGTYEDTLTNVAGCDSVATLNLTINTSTFTDSTADVCDSLIWRGTNRTTSGTYVYTYTNEDGCASADTLHLTVRNSSTSTTSHTACDSYEWNAVTYTTSGSYTYTTTNAAGCDSVATLNLTINASSTSTTTHTACNSYTWNGSTYTTSGTYEDTLTNAAGCDSVATLNLTINYSTFTDSTADVCDSLIWRGTNRTTSGTYVYTYTNEDGCASADTLRLTVRNSTTSTTSHTACDSYEWNADTYTTSGTYTYTTLNAAGCDSTATLNLTVNYSTTSSTTLTECNSYTWNGMTYTESGIYTYSTTNASGCDSTATLDLTIKLSTITDSTADVCDSLIWRGTNRTTSGTYVYTYTNEDGCASADTLRLTVRNSSTSTTTESACVSYTWNGTEYSSSGTYTYTSTNAAGCDSLETLVLTILNPTASYDTITSCDSYAWNGETYTTSGSYSFLTTNANGCDSTANLALTINATPSDPITGDATVCPASTITLSHTNAGGTWSSSDLGVLIIDASTGVVLGVSTGTADVTYTVTVDGCTGSIQTSIEVLGITSANITGSAAQCMDNTQQMTSDNAGGTWASTNISVATITDGLVQTVAPGNVYITYELTDATTGCVDIDSQFVHVDARPDAPVTVYGPIELCLFINQTDTLMYRVDTVLGASSYYWTMPPGMTLISGQNNDTIYVTVDSTMARSGARIYVNAVNDFGCYSTPFAYYIYKTAPYISTLDGTRDACPVMGLDSSVVYSTSISSTAYSYQWQVPLGATIDSGSGSYRIRVKFDTTFTSGQIRVTPLSKCGNGNTRAVNIARNLPVTPGFITGPSNACPYYNKRDTAGYKIAPVENATSYLWTAPANMIILDGQGTDSITVLFDTSFVSSALKVRAVSNCYTTIDRSLNITATPYATPGVIAGPSNPCQFIDVETEATYSIRKLTGATGYLWTTPTGAAIIDHPGGAGVNDTIITVQFATNFGNVDTIKVQSIGCNNSLPRVLIVRKSAPQSPTAILGSTNICSEYASATATSDTVIYRIRTVANASSYSWQLPRNCSTASSLTTTDTFLVVTFDAAFTSGNIGVRSNSYCDTSTFRNLTVSKLSAAIPAAIQKSFIPNVAAITNVSGMTTDTLRIRKVSLATGYDWSLRLGTNATITHLNATGPNDTAIVVNLLSGFVRDTVVVRSLTAPCAISGARTVVLSAIAPPPAATGISGTNSPCAGDTITYTATVPSPTVGQTAMTSVRWIVPANTQVVSANGDSTAIGLRIQTGFIGGNLSARSVSASGTLSSTSFTVTLRYGAITPTSITQRQSGYTGCVGDTMTYRVTAPAAGSNQAATSVYRWTLPANTSIYSANGDSSSMVLQFNSGYAGGNLWVRAQTACGILSGIRSLALTAPKTAPFPNAIASGSGNFYMGCVNDSIQFSTSSPSPTASQEAISVYRWSVPANASIRAANTDSSIVWIKFNAGYSGGLLGVRGQTACGVFGLTRSVTLYQQGTPTPNAIIARSGNYRACVGDTITYRVNVAAPNSQQQAATVYRWTIPANATILNAAADSASIRLEFMTGFTGGNLSVRGQTRCSAQGSAKTVTLVDTACPSSRFARISSTNVSQGKLRIIPNPNNGRFTLLAQLTTNQPEKGMLEILDARGARVGAMEVTLSNGETLTNVFGQKTLRPGMYMLRFRNGRHQISERMLVQ